MRIDLVCFTDQGHRLAVSMQRRLVQAEHQAEVTRCGRPGRSLGPWTREAFSQSDALVFVGSVGIAVRAIAPFLVGKTSDPAVVAIDDAGRFAVSVLSGHVGRANRLAETLASLVGAHPVVTTATDVNGRFAIDEWAAGNGIFIANPDAIRWVSAKLLADQTVTVYAAVPVDGPLPPGFTWRQTDADVVIDTAAPDRPDALFLVPPAAVLGIGCRRGVSLAALTRAFDRFCQRSGLHPRAFCRVCTLDRKADEVGLVAFCDSRGLPLRVFSADDLAATVGNFPASAFVRQTVGVDNVCQRSAIAGGGGRLLAAKTVVDGVAFAAALSDYRLDFSHGGDNPWAL
ncbi:MAG: cobalamin biosynthesis protein [Planctomycetes bacterium]|nr:cobalamin biosynthesis protein [Planctomycetota bacterium]